MALKLRHLLWWMACPQPMPPLLSCLLVVLDPLYHRWFWRNSLFWVFHTSCPGNSLYRLCGAAFSFSSLLSALISTACGLLAEELPASSGTVKKNCTNMV
uniref:HDC02575 n=1 Tax=Drosophila melanogaster TaxID=7227 RepID=Q6IHH4_DROME|nr:TPA_inf: HDC02575 [Drosophila melanogaster]